jgi:hypothetical protein
MPDREQTVLIVDDALDYLVTMRGVLKKYFPDARVLKADGTESAVFTLKEEFNKGFEVGDFRLIIDGLEGEWKDMVNKAVSLGIPKENLIVFSATESIQQEAEAMGIQFKLKPESPELESTIISIGKYLRL